MINGKKSFGQFKQIKDLLFPKGCGNILNILSPAHQITISPLARSFSLPFNDFNYDDEDSLSISKRQVVDEYSQSYNARRQNRRKNDGFYYPDYSGRYLN